MSHRSHLATPATRTPSTFRAPERLRPIRCVGNWQLAQLAGRGSLTEVYFAKPIGCPPDWPADYAVKLLRDEGLSDGDAIAALRREAEVGSQVSQSHLVPILESHVDTAPYYVVMPKLDGVSVAQVIGQVGPLSVRQALWITRQVAEGLDAMHDRDWLHGDVKPANVVISSAGHATLIDLGFAVRKREAMLTTMRAVRGTLSYMAPEVMTSALCADQRSDIYSLGITLFEMLTARLPFVGEDAAKLVEAHRLQPLPDPRALASDLPDEVVALVKRMTAKQPIRRPQSVRELVDCLLPLEVAAMHADYAPPVTG